jgi:hypothetical protein
MAAFTIATVLEAGGGGGCTYKSTKSILLGVPESPSAAMLTNALQAYPVVVSVNA